MLSGNAVEPRRFNLASMNCSLNTIWQVCYKIRQLIFTSGYFDGTKFGDIPVEKIKVIQDISCPISPHRSLCKQPVSPGVPLRGGLPARTSRYRQSKAMDFIPYPLFRNSVHKL